MVELMISVAVLAILLVIAVPGFRSLIENTQIRTAAESMQAGLSQARNEALRRNTRVSLWIVSGIDGACTRSSAGTSWVVSLDDPSGACAIAPSDTTAPRLIESRAGSDGSSAVSVSAVDGASPSVASSCITFNGFGRVEPACTDGGTPVSRITFSSSSGSRTLEVRVAAGGSVRLCNPAVTSSADPAYCGA
jgi:type IV fimbrial biogenesis protein FimT